MKPIALIASALLTGPLFGQVVINEAFENPPGSGDEFWEFIELYGAPGTPLDGYAVALLKGGTDTNGDGIPENPAEIDEAFALDGLALGANGLLLLVNDTGGFSFAEDEADPETTIAYFSLQHIATSDTPGKLANDWSSTYALVRRRPDAGGQFGTAWRKEIDPDENFDSRVDFGPPYQNHGSPLEPYQMADDIAWSHSGGKEYVRDGEDEISDTSGFNPDAISRVAYLAANPGFETSRADEEWVYGDLITELAYDISRSGGPTGFDRTGFAVTPGAFNDSAAEQQFRFVPADVNLDGAADVADLCAAAALLGAAADDTAPRTSDNGTPDDPSDDFTFDAWAFEGRELNGLLVALAAHPADGPAVTTADLAALQALVCVADWNADRAVNTQDFIAFLNGWAARDPCTDVTRDGTVNTQDFIAFLNEWNSGC
jgi:hypothetical protein